MSAIEAKESGCCFYVLPDDLAPEQVDELIRPAVFAINTSGWVWTAESCQGHPDATKATGWTHNTKPMLRLVTRAEEFGTMLRLLCDACYSSIEEQDETGVYRNAGLELWPQVPKNGAYWLAAYREVLVYVPALITFERNAALRVFERFAEQVVEYGEARGTAVPANEEKE